MRHYSETTIAAFMSNNKPAAIMKAADISKSTYYRLRRDPDFQKIVERRRSEIVKEAVLKMETYLLEDIEILQTIARDNETAPQIRINAISTIMSQLDKWKLTADLIERIQRIEDSLIENEHFSGGIYEIS